MVASGNAGKVKIAQFVPANEITFVGERPRYKFYVIPLPYMKRLLCGTSKLLATPIHCRPRTRDAAQPAEG
jgi:hypothetical protein